MPLSRFFLTRTCAIGLSRTPHNAVTMKLYNNFVAIMTSCFFSHLMVTTGINPLKSNCQHGRDRPHDYKIINDDIRYSGWRRVIRRTVAPPSRKQHHEGENKPDQRLIEFDIIDQNHGTNGAVIIFAWNSTSKTATIIREYMPGCHRILGGLAAGMVEDRKHSIINKFNIRIDQDETSLMAAQCELEEECHLSGGIWYRLTEDGISVPMDKYVMTEITPFLVIDPHHVENPRPLDEEEDIEILSNVSPHQLLDMIRHGDMTLVGGWGTLLALEKLRELGEI